MRDRHIDNRCTDEESKKDIKTVHVNTSQNAGCAFEHEGSRFSPYEERWPISIVIGNDRD